MKIRSIYIVSLFLAGGLFSSCNDWLTVDPKDKVSEDDMFSTVHGYESVLNGVYRNMAESSLYGNTLSLGIINVMSYTYDVSSSTEKLCQQAAEYRYEEKEFKSASQQLWSTAYNCIANANNLIQRLEAAPDDFFDKELDQKNLMLGEAYAARAYVHFDLLRLYAPAPALDDKRNYIPYVDYYPCKFATRLTVKEVLDKIVVDVKKARKYLAWDTTKMGNSNFSFQWQSPNSGNTSNNMFYGYRATRLNYYAATALMARVLLYRNGERYEDPERLEGGTEDISDREMAFNMASKVKSKTTYRYEPEDQFRQSINQKETIKLKREIIFSLWKESQDEEVKSYYTGLAKNYVLADYGPLYNKPGNTNDYRAKYFTYTTDKGEILTNRWYLIPEKTGEYPIIPMIRYSEILYIMADAIFYKDKSKAVIALQQARYGRNLRTTLNKNMEETEFYNLLIEDARKEFAGEGKMFFMYKRLNRKVIKKEKEEIELGGRFTLPIPDSEFILK